MSWQRFGDNSVLLGGAGVIRPVTITNTGAAGSLLTVTTAFSGTNANQLRVSRTTCPAAGLAAASSCVINVKFRGSSVGTKTAALRLTPNSGASQPVSR